MTASFLLDYSFYRFDLHHVELTVNYFTSGSRCVNYLTIADIDRNVAAVASVVITDDITRFEIASRYLYARFVHDRRSAVR